MKYILAVACASITGVSLGVALQHKSSVANASLAVDYLNNNQQASLGIHGSNGLPMNSENVNNSPYFQSNGSGLRGNPPQLETKLNSLLEQQNTMRNQQSELNRELNAIQFRLDTHSASFRPLQSERDTKSTTSGYLPAGLTPLLPPKQ